MEDVTVSILASIMTHLSLPYLAVFVLISYGLRNLMGSLVFALTRAKKYVTYGVFVIALVIGIPWYFIFEEDPMKLVVTYAFGTSLYELIIQAVVNKFKSDKVSQ